ncbi:MAG: hypothetical protein M3297_15030 [Thermoproteota archaeon]|nr:hypothetical protein [Thermoproteota archaeon]
MMTLLKHEEQFSHKPQRQLHLSPSRPPQQLCLEQISPKWASRLCNENIPTFMSLTSLQWRFELQRSSKCVVGEAYGYSSGYTETCVECDRIGCKFLYYFTLNWRRKLEQNKQEFVKHWNEVHIHTNARCGSFQG